MSENLAMCTHIFEQKLLITSIEAINMSECNFSKESLSESQENSESSHKIVVENGVIDFVLSKTSMPLRASLSTVSQLKPDPKVQRQGGSRPIPPLINQPPVKPPALPLEDYNSFRCSQLSFVDRLLFYVQNGVLFCKKVFSDSYRWQLFKSLLLCAVGYKLTKEYNKYTKTEPPELVNDREAWLERCRKYNERKKALEKPKPTSNFGSLSSNLNML